nr:class I SAM-dependent methyltransferase [Ardenticatenales bacterium]
MTTPRQLEELYRQGQNISAFLRKEQGVEHNTREIIEVSYDLQTGSYVAAMQDEKIARLKEEYSREIASIILALCEPNSILQAGVGEATTLSGVLQNIPDDIRAYGFDLSWSRVAYAKRWLGSKGLTNTLLCSGDLFNIPFLDNSVDVVYTSHSIEPNGGNEEPILRELYRVTRKFLILLEPAYELASDEARKRMDSHGYCKNLKGISDQLGYNVLQHKLFPYFANPLNPTALTIIQKNNDADLPSSIFA